MVWIRFIKFSIRNTIEQSVKKSDALEWEDLKPEESYERLFEHFRRIIPGADENKIRRFLK